MQERLGDAVDKATGIYHMATWFKGSEERTSLLLNYVCGKKICTEPQRTRHATSYMYMYIPGLSTKLQIIHGLLAILTYTSIS